MKNPLEHSGLQERPRPSAVALVAAVTVWGLTLSGMTPAATQPTPTSGAVRQDPFAECEARFAAAPEEPESARCFREVVRTEGSTRVESLRGEAVRRLEALWRTHPDNPHLPYNLATLEWFLSTRRVPDLYAEAARLFRERGAVKGELQSLLNRGRFLAVARRLDEAEPVLEGLAARATELGEAGYAVRARIEMARLRLEGGGVEEAWQTLHLPQVLAQVEEAEPGDEVRGDWLLLAGRTAYELGRDGEARQLLRTGLEEVSNLYKEASFLQELASVHISSALPTEEERRRVLRLLEEALEVARRSDNRSAQAHAHRFLGKLLEGEEGEMHLRRCVELARELEEAESLTALCQGALAVHLAVSAPEEARRRMRDARDALRDQDPWSRIFAELDHLRVDWAQLPRKESLRRAFETLDLIERLLVERSAGRETQARVRSQWLDPYHWLAGRLLEGEDGAGAPAREDLRRAFHVIERMRAQALAEALRAAEDGDRESRTAERATAVLGRTLELPEVEASLEPDEALLSFQIGSWRNLYGEFEGGAWLLASTRRGTRVYRLPDQTVLLAADIRRLEGLEDPEQATPLLVRLHRQLLGPALGDLPREVRRLVIVPDGPLHRLPFALLRSREAASASLIARYELSVVPSATLWRHWLRSESPAFRSPALVLADPVLADPVLADPAPRRETDPVVAAVRGNPRFGPLPHAREEGRAVVRRLGGGELWVGAAASEAALKREALSPEYAVLHLAAHAVADSRDPERSAVILSPGGGEDGRLTPAEILELDLSERLVVLAACETAAGELVRGEGVLSLTRYFFQAGARGVVASLWELSDRPAAELVSRFYDHLADGESLSRALAAAQRELLAAGGPARVWGGVAVFGDGTLTPFPEGRSPERPALPGLLLPIALLLGASVALGVWRLWSRAQNRRRRFTPDEP